ARNANDGISLAQVAEGAMDEVTTALQRIRTLAIQAQNGVNTTADRTALNEEVTQLKAEMSRIAQTTQFGTQFLLKGDLSATFLVGANAGSQQNIAVVLNNNGGYGISGLNLNTLSVSTFANAATALANLDTAIKTIDSARAELGATQNRFQATIRNLTNISENVSGARSRIRDTDFAKETAELSRPQILPQTSTVVLAQANQRPQAALSLLQG